MESFSEHEVQVKFKQINWFPDIGNQRTLPLNKCTFDLNKKKLFNFKFNYIKSLQR